MSQTINLNIMNIERGKTQNRPIRIDWRCGGGLSECKMSTRSFDFLMLNRISSIQRISVAL